MSKKIILFLSSYDEKKAKDVTFSCQNDLEMSGKQTNEAPTKYLLHTYSNVSEILCVVTPDAERTALPYFEQVIKAENSKVVITPIAFREDSDFSQTALSEIVNRIDTKDKILLETTGGFRNAAMYLLLVSRVLSYNGSETIGAVYANLSKKKIEDISDVIGLFDLVGGMQELSSFGSVRTLRKYYGKPAKDEKIENLIHAVEDLTNTITLCRTRLVEEKMEGFNQALDEIKDCNDPMMRRLYPAFRLKFGEEMTILTLIQWCVESDMLQQALTIYKERIPLYIMDARNRIIRIRENGRTFDWEKKYECREEGYFYEKLLKLGKNSEEYKKDDEADYIYYTISNLGEYLPKSYFYVICEFRPFEQILMDYLYIRILRNMINHANEKHTDNQNQLIQYLMERGYRNPDDLSVEDMKQVILTSIEHLKG